MCGLRQAILLHAAAHCDIDGEPNRLERFRLVISPAFAIVAVRSHPVHEAFIDRFDAVRQFF
jgi:hypothetical protein